MNVELISEILVFAILSSFISTQLIQRLKENFKVKKWLPLAIVSLVISSVTGFLFAMSFSDLGYKMSIWVGVISYAGAEIIYQNFKTKLGLKSLTELEKKGNENDVM